MPFSPDPFISFVVDRAFILDSQLAGHHAKVARAALVMNIKNRPLFPLHPRVNPLLTQAGAIIKPINQSLLALEPGERTADKHPEVRQLVLFVVCQLFA